MYGCCNLLHMSMNMTRCCNIIFVSGLLISILSITAFAFAPSPQHHTLVTRQQTAILYSSSEDGGIEDFETKRMDLVRSLQRSYYSDTATPDNNSTNQTIDGGVSVSTSTTKTTTFDASTGKIMNLPLWRVGWIETPGRRNCLNVHEMHYTHMFEKVLSQSNEEPHYFGHLYLPKGTTSAKSGEKRYQLKTWREELQDESRFSNYDSSSTLAAPDIRTPKIDRSAVIGCLMQVIDHRRMEDGRLMILVEAVERFVVDEIVDTLPYSVANVQILLDKEELPWENSEGKEKRKDIDEKECEYMRGKAVSTTFSYLEYEFDKAKLPVSDDDDYLTQEKVPYVEISQLLPFAKYSTNDDCLDHAQTYEKSAANIASTKDDESNNDSSELPMEQELWNGGILWDPQHMSNVIRRQDTLTCDALETLLWLALEDFCRATGFNLPEEVRCLLPPEMDYLDIQTDRYLSRKYPTIRRQKKLSYLAPALIENLELPMKGMRQVWLNTPSTKARLLGALERYEYLNNKMLGQFE